MVLIDVPESAWLSSNDRRHWADIKRRRKALRDLGRAAALRAGLRPVRRVATVTAHIQYATAGRADPNNAQETTKALIDGLVDAGIFIDDSSDYLVGPDHRRAEGRAPRHYRRVRFVIVEQDIDPRPASKPLANR